MLCDNAGAYGNQLLLGHDIAIVANPRSGGYTETSIIKKEDQQVIDVLIQEYDTLFKRILKEKGISHLKSAEDHTALFYLVMNMVDHEVEAWEKTLNKDKK